MSLENSLKKLELAELADRCRVETDKFFKRVLHDSQFCFELFRRAIVGRDQLAWDLVCVQYQPQISKWVAQHSSFEATGEVLDYFVNGTFGKISISLTPEKMERFPNLSALLGYIKMCVNSVIVDYLRLTEQATLQDIEDVEGEPDHSLSVEKQALLSEAQHELWEWVNSRLNDEQEKLVIQGVYVFRLKPRELYRHFKGRFKSVAEIYRILQNVLARLRRDPEARKFLQWDD